jgi:hypothetical protein
VAIYCPYFETLSEKMDPNIDEQEILTQLDFAEHYSTELEESKGSDVLGEADCPFCNGEDRSLHIKLGVSTMKISELNLAEGTHNYRNTP